MPLGDGCSLHAVVIGEHAGQIVTERRRRGEMDRVERPELNRSERRRGRAHVIVEWNLGKRGENAEDRVLVRNHGGRVASRSSNRSGELDRGDHARREIAPGWGYCHEAGLLCACGADSLAAEFRRRAVAEHRFTR
jgi:hypothetical protein